MKIKTLLDQSHGSTLHEFPIRDCDGVTLYYVYTDLGRAYARAVVYNYLKAILRTAGVTNEAR